MSDSLILTAATLFILTIAAARGTRLIVHDHYPPMEYLRSLWWRALGTSPRRLAWAQLIECPFCVAPYVTAVLGGWALAVDAHLGGGDAWSAAWWWWVVCGWAAVSYAVAMVVVRDEPPAEDE